MSISRQMSQTELLKYYIITINMLVGSLSGSTHKVGTISGFSFITNANVLLCCWSSENKSGVDKFT
jgi:hypothetical protein